MVVSKMLRLLTVGEVSMRPVYLRHRSVSESYTGTIGCRIFKSDRNQAFSRPP
jgi:hypothetical protein